jgi:hypothetical protein
MVAARPHPVLIDVVKAIHTVVFLAELGSIVWLVVSGWVGRRDRTVALAAGAIGLEALVFVANDRVCPLTPLTERLGAERGSVSDIFLPDAVARTIPIWSTGLIAVGTALHARSAYRRVTRTSATRPIPDSSTSPAGSVAYRSTSARPSSSVR